MSFTPEQETEIDIAAEARHRAWKLNRAAEKKEKADEDCAAEKHSTFVEGKCSNCGKEKPKDVPPTKKKSILL